MSRPRVVPPDIRKVDWTKAVILERKKAFGMTWEQIAEAVGMSPEVLRKLISSRPTVRWPEYTLKKVLKALDVQTGTYEIKIPEDKKYLR